MGFSQRDINEAVRRLMLDIVGDEKANDPVARSAAAYQVEQAARSFRFRTASTARQDERGWAEIGQAWGGMTAQAAGRLFRSNGYTDQKPAIQPYPYPGSRQRNAGS